MNILEQLHPSTIIRRVRALQTRTWWFVRSRLGLTKAPMYVYSARVKNEDIPFFEDQYGKNVDNFDAEVRATPERFQFAQRIGYGFFAGLKRSVHAGSKLHRRLRGEFGVLGNTGYHWTYLPQFLKPKSVVYCFGAGTDISFEVALAHEHGCQVNCFDPTPQAIAYAEEAVKDEPLVQFYPQGLYSEDTVLKFYKPNEEGLGSMSVDNLHFGDECIEAPVRRLQTIMNELGHDHIDLLKMDIEGSEYAALDHILEQNIPIDQLAMEFDQPIPPWRTQRYLDWLETAGYQLVHVEGLNCLFVHRRLVDRLDG